MLFSLAIVSVSVPSASALNYQSDVGINFTFNPTLSISLSPNNLTIPNLSPSTTDTSNEIAINVSTNNVYGYNLYATVGNETHNNTNFAHTNNTDIFSSIPTTANLPTLTTDNTWGYTYSLDNGTTWSNYNGLPLYTTDNPTRLRKNTGPSEDAINLKIAAKSSPTQPSGTYTNVINFIAVTKPTPVTLADVYASEGKELYKGYYKMQDMTPTICEETEDIGAQLQVIDIRDDKVYWISKLADNNCWMTQNLDLDLTSDPNANNYIALTSENTDLTDTTSAAYQDGYTVNETGVITWIPERDTIAYNNLNSTTWQNDNNHPYSYDYLDSNGSPVYPDSNVLQQTAGNHGLSGNYYNWPAAIASNDTTNISVGNASNSICPKGFKMPNSRENDFGQLFLAHGIIDSVDSRSFSENGLTKIASNPLFFIRSGLIDNRSKLVDYNRYSEYWNGTTAQYTDYITLLFFSNTYINASYYEGNNAGLGRSVRCLAR